MLIFLEELVVAAQISNADTPGGKWFTYLNLKYAFRQLLLGDLVSIHCSVSIVCGEPTGTCRFKTRFYGLRDIPTEFQKAMENTLQSIIKVFCFLDDILIVAKRSIENYNKIVENVFLNLTRKVLP